MVASFSLILVYVRRIFFLKEQMARKNNKNTYFIEVEQFLNLRPQKQKIQKINSTNAECQYLQKNAQKTMNFLYKNV